MGSRPDAGGTLGYRPSYLPFVCCPTFQKGAGPSHLRLKRQHMWCLPSSSRLPPTEQRGSKALAGEETDGLSHQWNQRGFSFPFHRLAWRSPVLPSIWWDVGATVEGATAIWNRFCMGDLRFKAVTFFSGTAVFQVESHVDLPYYKID